MCQFVFVQFLTITNKLLHLQKYLVEDRLVLQTSRWQYRSQASFLPCTSSVVGGARGRTPPTDRRVTRHSSLPCPPARLALRCVYRKREVSESVSSAKTSGSVETNGHRTTRKRKETKKKLCGGCRAASTWASGKRPAKIRR